MCEPVPIDEAICPVCQGVLHWGCSEERGYAYCARSGLAAQDDATSLRQDCDWSGQVKRIDGLIYAVGAMNAAGEPQDGPRSKEKR